MHPNSTGSASQSSQNATTLKTVFVSAHLSDAKKAAGDTGLTPAEILGVAALESGWGHAKFAVNGNNFFGLHAPALYQIGTLARQAIFCEDGNVWWLL